MRGATVCLNPMLSIILSQSVSVFLKGRCFLRSLTAKVSILRSSEAVVSSAPWWIEPKRRNCQWEDLLRFEKKPTTSIFECNPETDDAITGSKKHD